MSNQEAIALLRNLEDSLDAYCELNEEGKTAFRMAIEALSCSEFPNSSDAISRQQAIDALADMHCKSDEDGYAWIIRSDAWARIDALPSVTPKQKAGKAVFKSDRGKGFWVCNQCGERVHTWEKYCSECGAKLKGNE